MARKSGCEIFAKFEKPPPIPSDIYSKVGYQNDLNWVIASNKNTGSHVHQDPDLTGAWNYLINGLKWWVVFPRGFDSDDLQCDPSCSNGETETGSWFTHILPQLRNKTVFGHTIWEGVQYPGESIYLPFEMPHTVHNLEDNVAVTENYLFVDALPGINSIKN